MGSDETEPFLLPGADDVGDAVESGLESEAAAASRESFLVFVTDNDGKEPAGEVRVGTDGFGRDVIMLMGPDATVRQW